MFCDITKQPSAHKRVGNGLGYIISIKLHYNCITAHRWACSFRYKMYDGQLSFPVTSTLQECFGQMSSSISVLGPQRTDLMTAWSPDLRGTPVGKWLLYCRWASWDHPHTHSYEETSEMRTHTQTHTHRAVTGLWSVNSNLTWPSAVTQVSSPVTLVTVWGTKKRMTMEKVTACDSQPCCCCSSWKDCT